MKNKATKLILSLAMVTLLASMALGQDQKTRLSLEIDPATFVFGGYSAHLRIQPKSCQHLLVGLGAYAMDMPEPMVNINAKNRNNGWNVRINQGLGLFGEYYFGHVNEKFFTGAQIGLQEYKLENDNAEGSTNFTDLLVMAYGGYSWKPFNNGFYLKPWAGIGYLRELSGSNNLNGDVYDKSPITMFATLHMGFQF